MLQHSELRDLVEILREAEKLSTTQICKWMSFWWEYDFRKKVFYLISDFFVEIFHRAYISRNQDVRSDTNMIEFWRSQIYHTRNVRTKKKDIINRSRRLFLNEIIDFKIKSTNWLIFTRQIAARKDGVSEKLNYGRRRQTLRESLTDSRKIRRRRFMV